MYTGYELTDESRTRLASIFPPKYPSFLGHHVTEKFGVKSDYPAPEQPESVEVVGYADDDNGVEGLLVAINGSTRRPDGRLYHITWSIDRRLGRKPMDTNDVIKNAQKVQSIPIDVVSKNFTKSTAAYVKEKRG